MMEVNFFQRRKILKNSSYLDVTPMTKYEHVFLEDSGLVNVLIPKFKSTFFKSFVPRNKSQHITINLDEFGSATWLLIDGKKNVGTICKELEEKYGERIHPVVERITKYFTLLYTNKLITFQEILKKEK
jgi:hypothetical protein